MNIFKQKPNMEKLTQRFNDVCNSLFGFRKNPYYVAKRLNILQKEMEMLATLQQLQNGEGIILETNKANESVTIIKDADNLSNIEYKIQITK